MGSFYVTFQVGDPRGERWEDVRALVDTGAVFTWVPQDLLERLGVEPTRQLDFEIADGGVVQRDVGETKVRYEGQELTTIVIFGDPGSRPLLGAYTLEGYLLAPDPVSQTLIHVPGVA